MRTESLFPVLRSRPVGEVSPLFRFQDRFDRLLDEFGVTPATADDLSLNPRIDVSEEEDAFLLSAEMPGIGKDDVDLRVTEDSITLRAEKKTEREENSDKFHLVERRFGTFSRSLELPQSVDPDNVSAEFKDGVLTVTLPKAPEAQNGSRKIELK